jgi:hypothetical protein
MSLPEAQGTFFSTALGVLMAPLPRSRVHSQRPDAFRVYGFIGRKKRLPDRSAPILRNNVGQAFKLCVGQREALSGVYSIEVRGHEPQRNPV